MIDLIVFIPARKWKEAEWEGWAELEGSFCVVKGKAEGEEIGRVVFIDDGNSDTFSGPEHNNGVKEFGQSIAEKKCTPLTGEVLLVQHNRSSAGHDNQIRAVKEIANEKAEIIVSEKYSRIKADLVWSSYIEPLAIAVRDEGENMQTAAGKLITKYSNQLKFKLLDQLASGLFLLSYKKDCALCFLKDWSPQCLDDECDQKQCWSKVAPIAELCGLKVKATHEEIEKIKTEGSNGTTFKKFLEDLEKKAKALNKKAP